MNVLTDSLLQTALDAGWLRVRIRPSEFIGGDEAAWQQFAQHASDEDRSAAACALQRFLEHDIRGWDARQSDAWDIDRVGSHYASDPSKVPLAEHVLMLAEDSGWPILPLAGLRPCQTPETAWRSFIASVTCVDDLLDALEALYAHQPQSQMEVTR